MHCLLYHFRAQLESQSSLKRPINRDIPQVHNASAMSTERNTSLAQKTSQGMFATGPRRSRSRASQLHLLASTSTQLLNIRQRLKTLMTTAASKGAFLVDFSVVLQALLCRGGMDAGLAYPLVEQREQCLVAKWMAVETRLIESLRPSHWFTSSPSDCR